MQLICIDFFLCRVILCNYILAEGFVPIHTRPDKFESFISTVRPAVHTNPSRKRSFLKTLFKPVERENASLCKAVHSLEKAGSLGFRADGKHFEKRSFLRTMKSR